MGKYFLKHLKISIFILTSLTAHANEPQPLKSNIHPILAPSLNGEIVSIVEKQRVDLYLRNSKQIEALYISNTNDTELGFPSYEWIVKPEGDSRIAKPSHDHHLYILYQGVPIFSTEALFYDYINFDGVSNTPDGRQQLFFRMVMGGTANGELEDFLFVYYEPSKQVFQHKVIEGGYLPSSCDI